MAPVAKPDIAICSNKYMHRPWGEGAERPGASGRAVRRADHMSFIVALSMYFLVEASIST
jgi:hypothetical protein